MEEIHKLSVVEALGLAYLQKGGHLHQGQSLVLGGCFSAEAEMSAWVVCGGETIPQPEPKCSSNSPEGDCGFGDMPCNQMNEF